VTRRPAAILLLATLCGGILAGDEEPLPMPVALDPASLATDCFGWRDRPFGDRALEYTIGIPKRWRNATRAGRGQPPRYHLPTPIGRWREQLHGPEVEVGVIDLPTDFPTDLWIALASRKLGYELLRMERRASGARRIVDALVRIPGKPSRIARISGEQDGGRLFLVAGSAPEQAYAAHAGEIAAAVMSFRPEAQAAIPEERTETIRIEGPFTIELRMPEDWSATGASAVRKGHGLALLHPSAASSDRIFVRIHLTGADAATDDNAAEEGALLATSAVGFTPSRILASAPFRGPDGSRGRMKVLAGKEGDLPMEIRIYTVAGKQGRVTISAYCPSPATASGPWSRCRAALDVILPSIHFAE